MPQLISSFLQHANASGNKSTALKPIGWLIAILMSGFLISIQIKALEWIQVTLIVFSGISILLYIGAYVFFMIKDPDLLRSESFNIEKMAIQKGVMGDNLSGIIKIDNTKNISSDASSANHLEMKE